MLLTIRYTPAELTDYVNWLYFLHAWGLPSRLASAASVHDCVACRAGWVASQPEKDRSAAREAIRLIDDARRCLRRLPAEAGAQCRFGLFAARSDGDDILVTTDDGEEHRLPFLRQQVSRRDEPCMCLADFVSPHADPTSPVTDVAHHIGLFVTASTAAEGMNDVADPYERMLRSTLADRLAEAAAECLHEAVRRTHWGYAPDEHLAPDRLFAEAYQGRRPAIGYPSMPDQSLIFLVDRLLGMHEIGVTLTENGMMRPHAAVSGMMLGHPAARHFAVGCIDEEQLADYAARRGLSVERLRPFLAQILR